MKKSLLYIIAGLLGVFILVTGIVFWAGWLQLPWQNLNTQATRNSNQFVSSTVTALVEKQSQWESLEVEITKMNDVDTLAGLKSQQRALLLSMRTEAQLIDQKYLPIEVAAFLAAHEGIQ